MKKRFLFCALFLLPGLGFSQGIRKNFTEMTATEQDAYVYALNGLYDDDPSLDIVQSLSNDYWNYYDALYSHTCDHNEFLPFHRMMLWEMENAIQRRNPKLTIPYWDWTNNSSTDDPLFTQFLPIERLSAGWQSHLVRNLGAAGSLPVGEEVEGGVQSASEYCNDANPGNSYADQLQSQLAVPVENWIGGSMSGEYNLRDPLFYLHHAMLDKLWQNWYVTSNITDPNAFVLDRYDGSTNGAYIVPLPYTVTYSTSDVQDSRRMGIFYSNNGEADLNGGYAVTNSYSYPEYFSYPNQIVASDFNVPAGTSAVFVSQTQVTLISGFRVDGGHLEIDVGSNYYDGNYALSKSGGKKPINQKAPITADKFTIVHSSQGFTARLWLQNASEVQGSILGIDGKVAATLTQGGHLESGYHEFQLNVPKSGGSLYYAYFKVGNQTYRQLLPKF